MRHAASTVMAAAVVVSSLALAQPADPPPEQSGSPQMGEKMSHMISRPKTPTEYARNLKFIFEHELSLQDSFYAESNLKDVFNLEEVSVFEEGDGRKRSYSISAQLPYSAFPRIKSTDYPDGLTPSVHFVGGKRYGVDGEIAAGINFGMGETGPTFDETRQIFGENFTRLAPMPSPHGGPPPAKDPHGNQSWKLELTDGKTEKKITLSFNPVGRLNNILIEIDKK